MGIGQVEGMQVKWWAGQVAGGPSDGWVKWWVGQVVGGPSGGRVKWRAGQVVGGPSGGCITKFNIQSSLN